MEDARAARKAVLESGKIVQIGSQRRSAPNYHAANDFIRSGKFGKITMVEMCWNVNQPGRWRRPALVAQCFEKDTDWKRFLLNRPYEEWDPRKYLEYRLFWPYSSGIPGQNRIAQFLTYVNNSARKNSAASGKRLRRYFSGPAPRREKRRAGRHLPPYRQQHA